MTIQTSPFSLSETHYEEDLTISLFIEHLISDFPVFSEIHSLFYLFFPNEIIIMYS